MSWAKVNEERREKAVPKMPKATGSGYGAGAIERRLAVKGATK